MPTQEAHTDSPIRCRGRLTAVVNLSLCAVGSIFIIIGVLRSTLLLYVGCAFIGAAIGGFIRSRLPVHNMVPLHMMYRSDLQRMHAFNDGTQTFVLLRPNGISQSLINANTTIKTFSPNFNPQNSDAKDDVSVVSSLFDVDDHVCIICLVSFHKNQDVRQLRCGHFYHVACIDRWLRINEVCPTCRVAVTEQPSITTKAQITNPQSSDQQQPIPEVGHDIEEVVVLGEDAIGRPSVSVDSVVDVEDISNMPENPQSSPADVILQMDES